MELLGPSAAGLFLVGIAFCTSVVLHAGRVRIPEDPPDVELDLEAPAPAPVELKSVA